MYYGQEVYVLRTGSICITDRKYMYYGQEVYVLRTGSICITERKYMYYGQEVYVLRTGSKQDLRYILKHTVMLIIKSFIFRAAMVTTTMCGIELLVPLIMLLSSISHLLIWRKLLVWIQTSMNQGDHFTTYPIVNSKWNGRFSSMYSYTLLIKKRNHVFPFRCVDYIQVSKRGGQFGSIENCGNTISNDLRTQVDSGKL